MTIQTLKAGSRYTVLLSAFSLFLITLLDSINNLILFQFAFRTAST